MDVELPEPLHFGRRLAPAVARGEIPLARVDDAVQRVLTQQLRFAQTLGARAPADVLACAEHRALAREVATRAIVLLRNEPVDGAPVLPIDPMRRAARGRRSAGWPTSPTLGDRGSSSVRPPYVVTPLEGLRTALEPLGVEVVADAGAATGGGRDGRRRRRRDRRSPATRPRTRARASAASSRRAEVRPLLPPVAPAIRPPQLDQALWRGSAPTRAPVGRGGDRRSLTLREPRTRS